MSRILSAAQAEAIMQAAAHLNNLAVHEVNIEMFGLRSEKVRVCLFGNRVNVDLFGSFAKYDQSERYATQADFASAYNLQ